MRDPLPQSHPSPHRPTSTPRLSQPLPPPPLSLSPPICFCFRRLFCASPFRYECVILYLSLILLLIVPPRLRASLSLCLRLRSPYPLPSASASVVSSARLPSAMNA